MDFVCHSRARNICLTACVLLLSLFLVLVLDKPALSCDVAVISAKKSTTGRPVIWKNFDCSEYWHQQVKYFPAKTSKAGGYYMLYYNNPSMQIANGSPITPQSAVNEAGLAISLAAVYEDFDPSHEAGNLNTDLMQHAVEECATIADFENLIQEWPKSHLNHAISGNFVVIDANGGAALYEMYTGMFTKGYMPISYIKYDANTGQVVDNTGKVLQAAQGSDFAGFFMRTNFNTYLPNNPGSDRYVRGNALLAQLAGTNGLNSQNVMRILSKDVNGKQIGSASGDTNYNTTYCISRSATRSGTVIEGVAPGSDPRLTVMWVAPGEPSITPYVPTFVGAESLTPYLYMDTVNSNGTMSDTSDTCLLNLAEDYRETYKKLIYSSNRGDTVFGPYDSYINKVEMSKAQQWMYKIEDTVYAKTNDLMNQLQSNPSLITPELLKSFNDYCGKYIYDNYVAASATAVPWSFNMPSTVQDTTPPTAQISYSPATTTNQDVVATLVNESEPITVTNNGGSRQYTFTQNGSFTFEFKDAAGNTGTATAAVTWIDKEPPVGTITYRRTFFGVVATLTTNEPVTMLSSGGAQVFLRRNDSFTFKFMDAAGNIGTATATAN
ncbi:MAG: hypothetical protein ACOY31_08540 [Bacillota bacterium]